MTDDDLRDLVADALAEVYSGAGAVEADALIDHLADRGLMVVLDIDDTRTLET